MWKALADLRPPLFTRRIQVYQIYSTKRRRFCFSQETWLKKLEEYGPWFAEQESVKANETLRPGKPKTHDDLFGLDGSFRQLVID